MKKILFYMLIIAGVFGFTTAEIRTTDNPDDKYPGVSSIKSENLIKTVEYLASKELAGRLSGSDGYFKAADWMAGEFRKLGLKPMGNEGYFQTLNVEYNDITGPCRFYLMNNGEETRTFKLGDEFVCRGFTGSGKFTAPVVFCGYGFSPAKSSNDSSDNANTDNEYDDYSGIDVKGKIVMLFKQTPSWKAENRDWNQSLRYRAVVASQKGALGIIFVSKPNDANPQKPIGSVMDGEGEMLENLPMIHLDLAGADEILQTCGKTLKELQTSIDTERKPMPIETGVTAGMDITAKYTKNKQTVNVAGMLEGSDPKMKNEYIVIGAHLDHVGSQAGEIYFPGANDNASGSASVLEMARTFVNSGVKPKRSVLFILFSNEESGLQGATYYSEHPLVPLDKTVMMMNNDCIGHGDSLQIGNGKSVPVLWQITRSIDSLYTKGMILRTWNGGGADATPIHLKGVPCLYFVSYFSYTHLHLMSDTPETLTPSTFEKACKLGYMTACEVAGGNYQRETVLK